MESHTQATQFVPLRCLGNLQTYARNNLSQRRTATPAAATSRYQIVNGLFALVCKLQYSAKTAQLACVYLDEAATVLNVSTLPEMRQLAALCLLLASKFEERSQLDARTFSRIAAMQVSAEKLIGMEAGVLLALNWDLDRLTAAEVSRIALTFSAPTHDFTDVIKESDEFSSLCYMDSVMAGAGPILIGVAAVCCVFERHGSIATRDSWLEVVLPALGITQTEVLAVSQQIWNYFTIHFQVERPSHLIDGSK